MKRVMFVFAMALLLALAVMPSVSAAKDWVVQTGDWRFALFPESIIKDLKAGDNLDILGKAGFINGLGIKGEVRIPAGVNVYTDAGILVNVDAKLVVGEPLPAKPANVFGPYALETKARRGEAKPMGDENDEGAGWIISGNAQFVNVIVTGYYTTFNPQYGSYLKIEDSRITRYRVGVYGLRGGASPIVKRTVEIVRSTFSDPTGDKPDDPAYDLLASASYEVVVKAYKSVFGGGLVSYRYPEEPASAIFATFEDCEIRNPGSNWQKGLTLGYIVSRVTSLTADFDNDGSVGFSDFFAFAQAFGTRKGGSDWDAKYDLNGDGAVDFDDFFIFAANFGKSANVAAKKPVVLTPAERKEAQSLADRGPYYRFMVNWFWPDQLAAPETQAAKPTETVLAQNFPNPFNPATTIKYELAKDDQVTLVVYNLLGQVVRTLVNERQAAGRYAVVWDGKDAYGRPVASGIYIYRLTAGRFSAVKQMTLLK